MTPQSTLPPAEPASLQDVVLTDALTLRPSRAPRAALEIQALRQLIQQMAHTPDSILHKLVQLALEVCSAGSAGVSLLDVAENGQKIFRWTALAGAAAAFQGGTTPADWSPCGTCLQRGLPTLFAYPARYFTYFNDVPLIIVEGLVVPLRAQGRDIGTIWGVQHTNAHRFDAEDARILDSLGALTAAAVMLHEAREKTAGERQAEATKIRVGHPDRWIGAGDTRFQSSFAAAAAGMVLADLQGRFLQVNDSFCRMTGYRAEELFKLDLQEIMYPEDAEINRQKIKLMKAGKLSSFVVEERYLHKGSSIVWLRDNVSLVRDLHGQPASVIAISEDITDRKRAQAQFEATHERLERSAAELRRSNEDLEQFAYSASHDLKSPLKTVHLFSELLLRQKDQLTPAAQQHLGFVVDSAKRMGILIDDLLRYSQISALDEPIPGLIDAEAIVEDVIFNLKTSISETNAGITHGVLPKIKADPTLSTQLFQNLIANAIQYRGTEKPHVHISAEEAGDGWLFAVRDNGIGIEQKYWSAIFKPFKRLHGPELPGSGIGLAVCKKIVGRFGGKIWVESKPGEGSTFYFMVAR
jgi:PAS domain S-box-containing protein